MWREVPLEFEPKVEHPLVNGLAARTFNRSSADRLRLKYALNGGTHGREARPRVNQGGVGSGRTAYSEHGKGKAHRDADADQGTEWPDRRRVLRHQGKTWPIVPTGSLATTCLTSTGSFPKRDAAS